MYFFLETFNESRSNSNILFELGTIYYYLLLCYVMLCYLDRVKDELLLKYQSKWCMEVVKFQKDKSLTNILMGLGFLLKFQNLTREN